MAVLVDNNALIGAASGLADKLNYVTGSPGTGSAVLQIGTSGMGTVLAEVVFDGGAFTTAGLDGTISAADPSPVSASESGTAAEFRLYNEDDDLVLSGSVATSGGDLTISETEITVGAEVAISGLTIVVSAG